MTTISPPKPPTLYPVLTETLKTKDPTKDRNNKEDLVFKFYKKKGYRRLGSENKPIFDLYFHLCFEMFLLTPDWGVYSNKTLKDFPHLTEHLNYYVDWEIEEYKKYETFGDMIVNHNSHITFDWMFSEQCLGLNGRYLFFPEGVYYQMFKDEIDNFIDNELPKRDISSLMKENYNRVKSMRKKYHTLFNWGGVENTEPLEIIYESLPLGLVQYILKKLFQNFYKYRIGFMDCWMFDEKKKHLKLVEVKGVREHILPHQHEWLTKFFEFDVDVSVLRVKILKD